ncbi:hypothetical protein EMIHUDRAFT_203684 [Emiliania huxleyi CCMP1516]|uniref:Uncharacterized protein n=2 Tax=Emiliania huxleyi TaxID=2903 RepID=A0A0D3K082_EMIH1|nr:hypothetical protein EMIHUDRAFT_203684 [Emiliania huxleyi CCMP1516]EOD29167.1 hypothetical protein EMIHUDRAFT_203684 [Emiliania huxleyi CCMP1516]|eukprot:XP_005781596.1 hypothetical protein EMIHUDRAFT_203684 [Emiliania huxleyi CCMP1516]
MFGSSVAAFLATFWLLASMLLDIGTTSNLFRATLTLFMLATSYFLSSYSHLSSYACKTRDDRCLSMQTELDATKEDAAEERVSMQAKLDTKNVAEERVSMQAKLDTKNVAEERVSMQAELDAAKKNAAEERRRTP